MSKKKVAGIIILLILGIANVVLYLIFKQQYLDVLKQIYNVLNEPLPIVGITSFAVLLFLWKLIITARYGQGNINKIKDEYEKEKEEQAKIIAEYNEKLKEANEKANELNEFLIKLCSLIRNKKVKQLAEELNNGKETIDSKTEEE